MENNNKRISVACPHFSLSSPALVKFKVALKETSKPQSQILPKDLSFLAVTLSKCSNLA